MGAFMYFMDTRLLGVLSIFVLFYFDLKFSFFLILFNEV